MFLVLQRYGEGAAVCAAGASIVKERIWHDPQRLTECSDSSLVMTLQVWDLRAASVDSRLRKDLLRARVLEFAGVELDGARQQCLSGTSVDSDRQLALAVLVPTYGERV